MLQLLEDPLGERTERVTREHDRISRRVFSVEARRFSGPSLATSAALMSSVSQLAERPHAIILVHTRESIGVHGSGFSLRSVNSRPHLPGLAAMNAFTPRAYASSALRVSSSVASSVSWAARENPMMRSKRSVSNASSPNASDKRP